MALAIYEIANFNLMQFASIYNDFISSVPKELEVDWMDETGEIKTIKIKNVGAIQQLIQSDLIEEKNARINADKALDEKFTNEINKINLNLQNEINERIKAITELTTALNNEIKERKTDVDTLKQLLTDLKTNLENFEKSLTEDLEQEIKRAKAAEADLKKAIDDEADERKKEDAALNTKIDSINENLSAALEQEIKERKNADTDLKNEVIEYVDQKVLAEENRAKDAEKALDEKIENEIKRAQLAESDLKSAITNEEEARKTSDGNLQFNDDIVAIDGSQPSNLTDAINIIDNKFIKITTNLDNKVTENTKDIKAEAEIRAKADEDLKNYIDSRLKDLVANAPEALDTLKELADAINNNPDFASNLIKEINDLKADLDSKIKAEAETRAAADGSLNFNDDIINKDGSKVDNLTDAINSVDNKVNDNYAELKELWNNEHNDRVEADDALKSEIEKEAENRANADGDLVFDESIINFDKTSPTNLTEAINTVNKKLDVLLEFLKISIVPNQASLTTENADIATSTETSNITADNNIDTKQIQDTINAIFNQ